MAVMTLPMVTLTLISVSYFFSVFSFLKTDWLASAVVQPFTLQTSELLTSFETRAEFYLAEHFLISAAEPPKN